MKARDLMTTNPACCTPDDPAQRAAQLMAEHDCGSLPVVAAHESPRIVGVITDRDIAIRGVANGKGADARVRDLMTVDPFCLTADTDVNDVERVMAERQVRRVIVVDDARRCIGVIAQADLARAAERATDVTEQDVATVVERISAPKRSRAERSSPPSSEMRL